MTRFNDPQDCASSTGKHWHDHVQGEYAAAKAAGVTYVQTQQWFCVGFVCPGFVGSTPVTQDGSHLSREFSVALAPLLRESLSLLRTGEALAPARGTGDLRPTSGSLN